MGYAAGVIPILAPYGLVPQLMEETRWREWAQFIITIPTVAALTPPSPTFYEQWIDWATQFNLTLRLIQP